LIGPQSHPFEQFTIHQSSARIQLMLYCIQHACQHYRKGTWSDAVYFRILQAVRPFWAHQLSKLNVGNITKRYGVIITKKWIRNTSTVETIISGHVSLWLFAVAQL